MQIFVDNKRIIQYIGNPNSLRGRENINRIDYMGYLHDHQSSLPFPNIIRNNREISCNSLYICCVLWHCKQMAVIMEDRSTHFYEEIEPFCRWRRSEDIDTLELHLPPGFKKDHLKLQINNNGILTITGGSPVDQTKSILFRKETKVAKNCRRNEIRAKFSKGVLYVTMPKTSAIAATPPVPSMGNTSETQDRKANDIAKCASEFHSKFASLREILWRKTVVEGVVAVVVAAAAVVGAVKAYQYVMASPV
ncbi:unnamed protein product [Thlaspi arvense]|uniref:SHSP domain-containing protein n=1 Tax=Thlaspi arvense TaxID=13288 RepID=A0AAU9RPE7_THLAR|nr:unnamed protein product [Thlaspi arvense]